MAVRSSDSKLRNMKAKKEKSSKAKTSDKPILALPKEVNEDFVHVTGLKHADNKVKETLKTEKGNLDDAIFKIWCEMFFKNERLPETHNLRHVADDGFEYTGQFLVQQRFKINLPDCDDDDDSPVEDRLVEMLTQVGFSESVAMEIVKHEIDCNPEIKVRSIDYLLEGHYEERNWIEASPLQKSAGEKIRQFVLARTPNEKKKVAMLTDEEYDVVIYQEDAIRPSKDFLANSYKYCEDVKQLQALFSVIQPVYYTQNFKFGNGLSDDAKAEKLRPTLERLGLVVQGDPDVEAAD